MTLKILPIEPIDRDQVRELMVKEWGSDLVIVHRELFTPHQLPGFKAVDGRELTGLITYNITGTECEIITLNSFHPGRGIGDALIKAVEVTALAQGCQSCLLVTTNDNLNALGFYQKRGFCLESVSPGAVDESRKLKPGIPLIGENGIPLRDEITLKKKLTKKQNN